MSTTRTEADFLAAYPSIAKAWVDLSISGSFANAAAFQLFKAEGLSNAHLVAVDAALKELLGSFAATELRSQIESILKPETSKWNLALTELIVLGYYAKLGALASCGWPATGSATPPFDGQLRVDSKPIAFDVKPAMGSAFMMILQSLQEAIDDWAGQHALGTIFFELGVDNLGGQRPAGLQVKGLLAWLRAELQKHSRLPDAPLRFPLAGDGEISLRLRDAPPASLGSTGASVADITASVAGIIEDHAKHKAEQAAKHGGHFLLIYSRPYASAGSDIDSKTGVFEAACAMADKNLGSAPHQERWLGTVLLDWCSTAKIDAPQIISVLRTTAAWPQGVTVEATRAKFATAGNVRHV